MSNLKHQYNSAPICPYCDHEHKDSYDFYEDMSDGDSSNFVCDSCFKEFSYEVHYTRSYSTESLEAADWKAYEESLEEGGEE